VGELHHEVQGEVKGDCNYSSHYVETNGIYVSYVETTHERGDNRSADRISDPRCIPCRAYILWTSLLTPKPYMIIIKPTRWVFPLYGRKGTVTVVK
jgi:hypothetical protein